jgi:EAL and modified HD-GYP domain-containing signal transduction protein
MKDIFVARQPIYDQNNLLVGYEILYRSDEKNVAEFSDGKQASIDVILNSFINIGIENLVGRHQFFINITDDLIVNDSLIPVSDEQAVLEVLEDIKPTAEIVEGIKRLKKQGYIIALDDFKYSPDYDEILLLADYVKIDVLELNQKEIIRELRHLKHFKVKLLAEKVETHEMYDFCKLLGFTYFQGFHFCKPQLVTRKSIPANKFVVLNILEKLEKPSYDFNDVEKALAQDAILTFKILRYVNRAAFAQRKEIESIREALALVGGDIIKKWATLILMTQLSEGKPQALLITALVRARMCELVANTDGRKNEQIFTIGLLSFLDALMGMEMKDLLSELSFSTLIKNALLMHKGENGEILENVILYERGQWNKLIENDVDAKIYFSCYIDAVQWAETTVKDLTSS